MSGFLARRAMQEFPEWQKAGNDPSANINILLRNLIDPIEVERNNQIIYHKDSFLFKEWLESGDVFCVTLDSSNTYAKSISGFWNEKKVLGESFTLEEVETPIELMSRVDRDVRLLDSGDSFPNIIYEHEPVEIEHEVYLVDRILSIPNQLTLEILSGSFENVRKDSKRRGVASFVIFGRDNNNLEIQETIDTKFFGCYKTKHTYSYVEKIQTNEGAKLFWSLSHGPTGDIPQQHPFFTISDHQDTSPLYLMIEEEESGYFLNYYLRNSLDSVIENQDRDAVYRKISSDFLTLLEGPINSVANWFVHPRTGMIYVSCDGDKVLIIQPKLPEFKTLSLPTSYNSFIKLVVDSHSGQYNEPFPLWTKLITPVTGVTKMFIFRKSPAGVVNYLQADRTWSPVEFGFLFNRVGYEEWQDLKFYSTLDEEGQWEFYVQCTVDTETVLSGTSVYVAFTEAIGTIAVDNDEIFFARGKNLVCLKEAEYLEYELLKLGYLADKTNNLLYLADSFSTVEVSNV